MRDVDSLVEWLGCDGAKAGLSSSKLSLHELVALAKAKGLPLSQKPTRQEVVHELVYSSVKRIERSTDQLLTMNVEELIEYFEETKPSRIEIIRLLADLGISVSSAASRSLVKFAARELSDLGMYQRVAQGSHRGGGRTTK
jgi:hypothetical protein